jgi:hypothetical protein
MTEPHLPRPSIWPVTLGLGVAVACAGAITHPLVLATGGALAALALGGWVVDAVRGA